MDCENEIIRRNEILKKLYGGNKITPTERLWLATHRVFNRLMGFPYLNMDIISLQPNVLYRVSIKVESVTYTERIVPIITVPAGKGMIKTHYALANHAGKKELGKPVKMLGAMIDANHRETEFSYRSELGVIGISFECDYFDSKQQLMIRKNSDTGDPNFAMIDEKIASNRMRYRCKAPTDSNFESFVFIVEWEPL